MKDFSLQTIQATPSTQTLLRTNQPSLELKPSHISLRDKRINHQVSVERRDHRAVGKNFVIHREYGVGLPKNKFKLLPMSEQPRTLNQTINSHITNNSRNNKEQLPSIYQTVGFSDFKEQKESQLSKIRILGPGISKNLLVAPKSQSKTRLVKKTQIRRGSQMEDNSSISNISTIRLNATLNNLIKVGYKA